MRSIGTSNFSVVKTSWLLKHCRIKPAVNQVGWQEVRPHNEKDVPGKQSVLLGLKAWVLKGRNETVASVQRPVYESTLAASLGPALIQVEMHPYFRNDALLHWCKEHDIHVTAYSPLGAPDSPVVGKPPGPQLMEDPTVLEVAKKHGKSPVQVQNMGNW